MRKVHMDLQAPGTLESRDRNSLSWLWPGAFQEMRRAGLEVLRRPEELSQGRGTVTTPGLTNARKECQT
jgi:hypothetical protein